MEVVVTASTDSNSKRQPKKLVFRAQLKTELKLSVAANQINTTPQVFIYKQQKPMNQNA